MPLQEKLSPEDRQDQSIPGGTPLQGGGGFAPGALSQRYIPSQDPWRWLLESNVYHGQKENADWRAFLRKRGIGPHGIVDQDRFNAFLKKHPNIAKNFLENSSHGITLASVIPISKRLSYLHESQEVRSGERTPDTINARNAFIAAFLATAGFAGAAAVGAGGTASGAATTSATTPAASTSTSSLINTGLGLGGSNSLPSGGSGNMPSSSGGGGTGLQSSDYLSLISSALSFLGGKDQKKALEEQFQVSEDRRTEAKRRLNNKNLKKALDTWFPGLTGGDPDESTAGGALASQLMQLLQNPGQLSPAAYERDQEQAAQTRQLTDLQLQGAGAGAGFGGGFLESLRTAAALSEGAQRTEAARKYTQMQEELKRQDLNLAFNILDTIFRDILGLQSQRANIAQGNGALPQVGGSPYDKLGQSLAMLATILAERNNPQASTPTSS